MSGPSSGIRKTLAVFDVQKAPHLSLSTNERSEAQYARTVRCPRNCGLTEIIIDAELNELTRRIGAADLLYLGKPEQAFGIELRCAALLMNGDFPRGTLDEKLEATIITPPDLRHIWFRPASEPIIYSLWGAFQEPLSLTSLYTIPRIVSPQADFRNNDACTSPAADGTRTVYPPAAEARMWIDELTRLLAMDLHPLVASLATYAIVALHHPLTDGNGRLARALFWLPLAKGGIASTPFLPLAITQYSNPNWMAHCLAKLSATSDWNAYINSMSQLLNYGMDCHDHYIIRSVSRL